ncbi:hypothetical protein KCU65_g8339, partial [Aureobasidium melanogenum]
MDHARLAWQKSIWISLTVQGDRKKLITPAQRTSSGLACRNIFNTQFVQLLEAYDDYGPHKGVFVPRLEPSDTPEVGFEIHWDKLGDVLDEQGTAPTSAVEQSTEEGLTVNSLLESHRKRKRAKIGTDDAEQMQSDFAESRCTTTSELAMPGLTPTEMSARATAELKRRKKLRLREQNGEIQITNSRRPAHVHGIGEVLTELESYILHMQVLFKAYRQAQLKAEASVTEVAEQDILRTLGTIGSALAWVKQIREGLTKPTNPCFGGWENSLEFNLYGFSVDTLERAVKMYSKYAPQGAPSQAN